MTISGVILEFYDFAPNKITAREAEIAKSAIARAYNEKRFARRVVVAHSGAPSLQRAG
jgi:hypothetical protein